MFDITCREPINSTYAAQISKSGYSIIMWTVGIENKNAHTPKEMADRVLNLIGPGEIILLHDGRLDRSKTVQALPLLLDGLKDKGYKVTTVGQLLKEDQTPRNVYRGTKSLYQKAVALRLERQYCNEGPLTLLVN